MNKRMPSENIFSLHCNHIVYYVKLISVERKAAIMAADSKGANGNE